MVARIGTYGTGNWYLTTVNVIYFHHLSADTGMVRYGTRYT
jgi:hypothetical protein